jgi:hypothetical protein
VLVVSHYDTTPPNRPLSNFQIFRKNPTTGLFEKDGPRVQTVVVTDIRFTDTSIEIDGRENDVTPKTFTYPLNEVVLTAAEAVAALGLKRTQDDFLNWSESQNERWVWGAGGQWHFILPSGELYAWNKDSGTDILRESSLVAKLTAVDYETLLGLSDPNTALEVPEGYTVAESDARFAFRVDGIASGSISRSTHYVLNLETGVEKEFAESRSVRGNGVSLDYKDVVEGVLITSRTSFPSSSSQSSQPSNFSLVKFEDIGVADKTTTYKGQLTSLSKTTDSKVTVVVNEENVTFNPTVVTETILLEDFSVSNRSIEILNRQSLDNVFVSETASIVITTGYSREHRGTAVIYDSVDGADQLKEVKTVSSGGDTSLKTTYANALINSNGDRISIVSLGGNYTAKTVFTNHTNGKEYAIDSVIENIEIQGDVATLKVLLPYNQHRKTLNIDLRTLEDLLDSRSELRKISSPELLAYFAAHGASSDAVVTVSKIADMNILSEEHRAIEAIYQILISYVVPETATEDQVDSVELRQLITERVKSLNALLQAKELVVDGVGTAILSTKGIQSKFFVAAIPIFMAMTSRDSDNMSKVILGGDAKYTQAIKQQVFEKHNGLDDAQRNFAGQFIEFAAPHESLAGVIERELAKKKVDRGLATSVTAEEVSAVQTHVDKILSMIHDPEAEGLSLVGLSAEEAVSRVEAYAVRTMMVVDLAAKLFLNAETIDEADHVRLVYEYFESRHIRMDKNLQTGFFGVSLQSISEHLTQLRQALLAQQKSA